jgi:hypothetical protein
MQSLQEIVTDKQDQSWIGSIRLMFNSKKYSSKALVILEGKTDIGLYRAASANDCIYFDSPCDGKKTVLDYVEQLRVEGMEKVFGVCDADFDHIRGISYDNVHLTDVHDIEMMMLSDNFLLRFFYEFTSHQAYDYSQVNDLIVNIKDKIFQVCYHIGILKWVNYDYHLKLNFKKLGYHLFINISGFDVAIDEDKYIEHILLRSKNCTVDKAILREMYEEYKRRDADFLHICNGHDFSFILAMLYRTDISTDRDITQSRVESLLRVNYELASFFNSNLYSCIKRIIDEHSGVSSVNAVG